MSFADRDGLIWLDGEMVPWREAKVHVLTHTLHYGMGVFEGVRAYKTPIRAPASSARRAYRASVQLRAYPLACRCLGVARLLEAQRGGARERARFEAYIRPMCFYGSEGMGLRADNLKVHCIVAAWAWGAYLGTRRA
jgi:branched-chain amino acid aminotransferase